MNQVLTFARKHALDGFLVVLAIYGAVATALESKGTSGASSLVAALAVSLLALCLLARHRFPFAAPASMWVFAAAISFVDGGLVPGSTAAWIAGVIAAVLLGNLSDPVRSRLGLVVVVCGAAIVSYNIPDRTTTQVLLVPLQFSMVWLGASIVQARAARADAAEERAAIAERERESAARLAVAEERARIARELHDVVAHSVSVMVLQVGAVRTGLPASLDKDAEVLRGVEETGRTALTEMRRLLGAMRHEGDDAELAPQPGLDDLGTLIEDFARSGLPVDLKIEGVRRPLPRAIDLSAYRIVQEGLTNSLRHANASRANVTILYGEDDVRIEVRDDGIGEVANKRPGFGLVGINERVKIFGGEMEAGPSRTGGFVLRARLPLGGKRS